MPDCQVQPPLADWSGFHSAGAEGTMHPKEDTETQSIMSTFNCEDEDQSVMANFTNFMNIVC